MPGFDIEYKGQVINAPDEATANQILDMIQQEQSGLSAKSDSQKYINTGLRSGLNKKDDLSTLPADIAASVRGFGQGLSWNTLPTILSILPGKTREEWINTYNKSAKESPFAYNTGNIIGGLLTGSAEAKGIAKAFPKLAQSGLVQRLLTNLGINAAEGAVSNAAMDQSPLEGALIQGGVSLGGDVVGGVLGKAAQTIGAKTGAIDVPAFKKGIDYQPVEAAEALKREMNIGSDLQLVPEQIMRQPTMTQGGVSPDRIIEQQDIMKNYARELEANVGLPSGTASTKYTQVEHDALAPRLDRQAVASQLGEDISNSYKEIRQKYNEAYQDLSNQLETVGIDTFEPKLLNESIKNIRDKISSGSGLTTQRVEQFINSMKSKGFTESNKNGELGKLSLNNLFSLREDVSDLAFETTSLQSKKYLEKIKRSIDSELNNYALSTSVKNPDLAQRILDLNKGFSDDVSRYEKSNIASILNKSKNDVDLLNDPLSITKSINKAIASGDVNTLKSIERLVPPDTLQNVKQEASQYILRGKDPFSFDFRGMQTRMQEMSPEAKKFLFGNDVMKYENMAIIGKYLDSTWKYASGRYGPPDNLGLKNPATYSNYIRFLAAKFNNSPTITKMMTRDYKKIVSPSAASLAAKKYVNELFRLESAQTGKDNKLNESTGE